MNGARPAAALVALGVLVAGLTVAQGPQNPSKFPPPLPAEEIVIRPGATIELGIPDADPPTPGATPGGRPTTPGGTTPGGANPGGANPGGGANPPGGAGLPGPRPGQLDPNQNLAGAYPAPAGARPPEGVSAAGPLRVAHWTVWRRVTDHGRRQPAMTIYGLRISADGQRIALCGYEGVRTVRPNGADYATITTKRTEDGNLDINADGTRVAWYSGEEGLWIANADGTGRKQLAAKGVCHSVRISADGKQVFVIGGEMDGIAAFPADGGPGRQLVSTARAAQAVGVDANGNHWRGGQSGLDVSGSGERIVFQFLWDALACDLRTGAIRRITGYTNPEDRGMHWVRLSWDGSKVAWQHDGPSAETRYLAIQNWDGSGEVRHTGDATAGSDWAQLSHNGARLATSWGLRLFASDGPDACNPTDLGGQNPLNRVQRLGVAGSGRLCCVEVEEAVADGLPGCGQIYVAEFDPPTLNGAPAITGLTVTDPVIKSGGGSSHFVQMEAAGAPVQRTGVVLVRPGASTPRALRDGMDDRMGDPDGKQPSAAGPRPLRSSRLGLSQGASVPPGPVTVRVFVRDTEGRITVIDAEGMEVR